MANHCVRVLVWSALCVGSLACTGSADIAVVEKGPVASPVDPVDPVIPQAPPGHPAELSLRLQMRTPVVSLGQQLELGVEVSNTGGSTARAVAPASFQQQ